MGEREEDMYKKRRITIEREREERSYPSEFSLYISLIMFSLKREIESEREKRIECCMKREADLRECRLSSPFYSCPSFL